MKKVFVAACMAACMSFGTSHAQTVKKVVKSVEHETAEAGSKGYAKVKTKAIKANKGRTVKRST